MSRKRGAASTLLCFSLAVGAHYANDYGLMTATPFVAIRPAQAQSGLIFLCDHASPELPEGYGSLGLPARLLATHIAYDIGAAEIVRALAARFAAVAFLASWSRLLIDLNRGEDDPTLVMQLSDGSLIPGNRDIGPEEIARRIAAYHAPYHAAIAAEIAAVRKTGMLPVLLSIHSFTPVWKGCPRPWELGILWDRDGRLAQPLIKRLSEAGFITGDNEPYNGALENDTLNRHGTQLGLPHVLIEIRQDLIAAPTAAGALAARLAPILEQALSDMGSDALDQTTHN
ncbi:MAG: N-formylglutamate amidohydrolase [Rhizomicrobium sp.]|nr:N-formylglutamate amidohydrolase [Rhizomicrobium sp.]